MHFIGQYRATKWNFEGYNFASKFQPFEGEQDTHQLVVAYDLGLIIIEFY